MSILAALRPTIEHAFTVTLPECAALRAGARAILAAERPTAIVATYETGPYQRALTIEGARAGIPTVGLMHGMIFDNHYDYMHQGVGVDPSSAEMAFTIPVRTCVWGPRWKRSLTEGGHYPCEAVAVTGNWRYDWLAKKAWRRDELGARLGAETKPVVAILSGGQDRHAFLPACLDAVASVGGLPRIRLHPSEDPAPVRDMLAKLGLPEAVLTEEGTLANLVVASDAVLVQFSTAVSEAIMLDRPTIVVDILGRGWYGAPRDSDAALIALSADEVAVMLRRALKDAPTREALAAARSHYLEDHFLALDGGAARRVATVVADATAPTARAGVSATSLS